MTAKVILFEEAKFAKVLHVLLSQFIIVEKVLHVVLRVLPFILCVFPVILRQCIVLVEFCAAASKNPLKTNARISSTIYRAKVH
jgi:hypothetical protein